MYRHLLVPLDSSDRCTEGVGNAVELARTVGARITFLHVGGEPADDGSARTAEVLAKAEAAAHAYGVPCGASRAAGGPAGESIVAAARGDGCDLIFVAAAPAPGLPSAVQVPSLLLQAGIPVLWSSHPADAPAHAIGILRDEHRSLAAVLHASMSALATARSGGHAADPVRMRAIVRYLQLFSTSLHHPKEERHLFRRLRARTDCVNAELDELERQHVRDRALVADLARRVDLLPASTEDAAAAVGPTRALEDALRSYAAFQWEHMGREESVILPAAQRHLTPADWSAIDAGFIADLDPRSGGEAAAAVRRLLSTIVDVAETCP
jgi:hemerythrin-like domain-containing protein/nucleotide-binding universal stress UspA family protein